MPPNKSPFQTPTEKRSPFPHPSLPQPGESSKEAFFDLFFDSSSSTRPSRASLAVVAATEWILRWMHATLTPWFWTVFALGMGAFAAWQFFRIRPQLANLRQGIRGEREVGDFLEEMRELGYKVFHDIPGEGFNVDHALIGPGGIFAIETRRFQAAGPDVKVDYDGKRVFRRWIRARSRSGGASGHGRGSSP